jgi:MtN3 and saliva related transmembrane protein
MLDFFLLSVIGILATLFAVSSTLPQILKAIKTKKMDDVSAWLIITLIVGLFLWFVYGMAKGDVVIVGGNLVGVLLNLVLLVLKMRYSKNPIS